MTRGACERAGVDACGRATARACVVVAAALGAGLAGCTAETRVRHLRALFAMQRAQKSDDGNGRGGMLKPVQPRDRMQELCLGARATLKPRRELGRGVERRMAGVTAWNVV